MNFQGYKEFDDWWNDFIVGNPTFDGLSKDDYEYENLKDVAQSAWKAARLSVDDDWK